MGWAVGEHEWRDVGYGVPAQCDHPRCRRKIDRGLAYVCGSIPYGGGHGCGLFFCEGHRQFTHRGDDSPSLCTHCRLRTGKTYAKKPDLPQWMRHKLRDASWAPWRAANPEAVAALKARLLSTRRGGPAWLRTRAAPGPGPRRSS